MASERQSLQRTITTLHQEKEGLRKNHEARVASLEGELEALRQETQEREEGLRRNHEIRVAALEGELEALRREMQEREEGLRKNHEARVASLVAELEALRQETQEREEGLRKSHETHVASLESELEALRHELQERGREKMVESGDKESAMEDAQRTIQQLLKVCKGNFGLNLTNCRTSSKADSSKTKTVLTTIQILHVRMYVCI